MGVRRTHNEARRLRLGLCLAALFFVMVGLTACGAEDTGAVQSCTFHSDCAVGTSCNFENKCIEAPCKDCKDDPSLVCLVNEANPDGVCSRPECTADDECDAAAGETCNDGLCTTGGAESCNGDSDCGPNETCNLQNECVPDDGDSCTDSTDCADDEICDETNTCVPGSTDACGGCDTGEFCNTETSQCEPEQTCDPACAADETCNPQTGECESNNPGPCGGCAAGETCNTDTNQCEPQQTCDPACTDGQICDTSTGTCVDNTCPPGTPGPDDCTGEYDKFNPDGCFCAQCLSDSDCDTAAGETCNPNGECMTCNETCDAQQGGSNPCSDPGFYCVSNCCVECLGATDCAAGQVCVDGSCSAPPDCSVDPSVCTGGTVCDPATNTCVPQQGGSSCSSDADCQQGQFCDPQSGSCQSISGGGGTCDPACPGGPSACFGGMACTCPQDGNPFDPTLCPAGQICFFGMCMAF